MTQNGRNDRHLSEQRFQLLINAITDYAIYMIDREGHVATWNPGARRFKGYEADEIIGQHFSRFFQPEDRAAGLPERALATAAREGRFEAEGWRVRKDGTRFWASVVIDPVHDPEGELIGFAKITRDISDKKQAERALFESEQRFRMLVQGVRDYAIYLLDPEGRITNWNTGAAAIKGYGADEIVGQHFSRFYTPEDVASGEPARALQTALREGKYEREAWRVRKDGSRFWANVVIDPIFDDRGELVGFAKITRDMTEKRLADGELEEARAALFQSQKMQALGELTGGIAHDFNNLMTVIRGSADLLRKKQLSEEKSRRYLDAIIETADRATRLTSHLLAFSRRQALKPEVIDVNLRIDAIGEVLGRTIGSRIEIRLDLDPELWFCEADPTELETALLNAAFNARDAMPDGGTLILQTRNQPSPDGDLVEISLIDTGEGMSEEVLQRAFEPFFTTKPVGKGTGLGLSQIHGFAAQSGGRAEVETAPGQGTTIRILLPRSSCLPAGERLHEALPEHHHELRVLLVEDNPHVLVFAEQLLSDLGHQVTAASSAEEALRLVDQGASFDLLFTDVVMPMTSGVALAEQLRERDPKLPVILATGYSDEVFSGAGAAYEVLRKPYDGQMLGAAIRAAMESHPLPVTS